MAVGKTAFLFPGQGSQKVGMGSDLYSQFSEAQAVFDKANAVLGFDITDICFHGPDELLKQTENAQCALYTCSIAALHAFCSVCKIEPDAAAGHSVGEYAALQASGCFDFEDGLRLVRKRGELMRDAAAGKPGTMAAVLGLDAKVARDACDEARAEGAGLVVVANYNGGGQVVISGEANAVTRAGEIAKLKGARRILPLAVSGAFHSPLMVNAGDQLFASISKVGIRKPKTAVITNFEARYVGAPADVTAGLTMQVSGSVRWEESMEILLRDGIDTFVEFGSGEVLCGLIKRMAPAGTITTASVTDSASLQAAAALFAN